MTALLPPALLSPQFHHGLVRLLCEIVILNCHHQAVPVATCLDFIPLA